MCGHLKKIIPFYFNVFIFIILRTNCKIIFHISFQLKSRAEEVGIMAMDFLCFKKKQNMLWPIIHETHSIYVV